MARKRSRQRKRRGGRIGGGKRRVRRKGGKKPGAKQRRRRSRRGGLFGVLHGSTFNPMRLVTRPALATMKLTQKLAKNPSKRDKFLRNLTNVGMAVSQLRKMK